MNPHWQGPTPRAVFALSHRRPYEHEITVNLEVLKNGRATKKLSSRLRDIEERTVAHGIFGLWCPVSSSRRPQAIIWYVVFCVSVVCHFHSDRLQLSFFHNRGARFVSNVVNWRVPTALIHPPFIHFLICFSCWIGGAFVYFELFVETS